MSFVLAEDAAIKSYLAGITVSDEKNSSRPVKVWFGYPDVEIRTQDFPFITIDLISIRNAVERQMSGSIYDQDFSGTINPVTNVYYEYEVPIAYDLMYQITTYSRHPRHDRAIIFQLSQLFPGMRGHLPVPNELGTHIAYRHMFLESTMKNDRAEGENGNKRLLRNIYTVRVVSEMTPAPATAAAIPGVTVVKVNQQSQSSVPADKTIVK